MSELQRKVCLVVGSSVNRTGPSGDALLYKVPLLQLHVGKNNGVRGEDKQEQFHRDNGKRLICWSARQIGRKLS